jgi:hypothetical protein
MDAERPRAARPFRDSDLHRRHSRRKDHGIGRGRLGAARPVESRVRRQEHQPGHCVAPLSRESRVHGSHARDADAVGALRNDPRKPARRHAPKPATLGARHRHGGRRRVLAKAVVGSVGAEPGRCEWRLWQALEPRLEARRAAARGRDASGERRLARHRQPPGHARTDAGDRERDRRQPLRRKDPRRLAPRER